MSGRGDEARSIWSYHDTINATRDFDIVGYDVEALDGDIGKVGSASREADRAHLVVDTGFWIFGKQRLIPAGVVSAVDHDQRRIRINMSKDQVRSAPDWDESALTPDEWRDNYDSYYASFGWWPGGEPTSRG